MREYWDRFIRDGNHFRKVVDYIHENPVKAKLCACANDWRWSSAFPGNAEPQLGVKDEEAKLGLGAPRR